MPHSLRQNRVLLLGASGKLGRMVRPRLEQAGCTVIGVRRDKPQYPEDIQWSLGDSLPHVDDVRAVFALWGVTSGASDALEINRRLALSAQELADHLGAELVVHCSSAAVYGSVAGPLAEAAKAAPLHPYGRAKLMMEQDITDWVAGRPNSPRTVILRIGNVAGADSLFANLRPGGRVTLHRFADGDGPRRSYLAPDDLARTLLGLMDEPGIAGIYNLSAARTTAMADLVRAAGAEIDWLPAPSGAVQDVALVTRRLQQALPDLTLTSDATELVNSASGAGVWP